MRPSAPSGREQTIHLLLHLYPPTPLLNVALKDTDASQTKVLCVTHVFLSGLHQFHTSNTLHELQNRVDLWCQVDCECVCVCVSSLACFCMSNDPSLLPTGTQTVPNRFAVTLWSMRIPTTDWCASWRRRCLVWKISSTPRAWVTSLRVRDHVLDLCDH